MEKTFDVYDRAQLWTALTESLNLSGAIIRIHPVRDISGTDILRGNFFSSCTLKVSGMSTGMYQRFDDRVFVVRYYENETACSEELHAADLSARLAALPGLGQLFYGAVMARDYTMIMGNLVLGAVLTLAGNLLADFCYGLADPRIRNAKDNA